MPIHYNIETDALYLRGYALGYASGYALGYALGFEKARREELEKYNYLVITNCIVDTDFDNEKIAHILHLPLDFVQKVYEERPNFIAVNNFLNNKRLSDKKIAIAANVTLDFVKKVKFLLAN